MEAWGKLCTSILVLIVENKLNKLGSLQNSFKQFYLFACLWGFFRVKASDIIQIHNTVRYLILILAESLLDICLVSSVFGNMMIYYYNQVISLKHHKLFQFALNGLNIFITQHLKKLRSHLIPPLRGKKKGKK